MMQHEKKARGFSILGTVMAMGMMGALSLVLAHLLRQQVSIQKKTEIYFELNRLSNKILRSLYDGDGCMETFGKGFEISDGENLSAIKNKKGEVVVDKTQIYGNRLLKIHAISIANVEITGKSGQLDLQVVFKKLGSSVKGYDKAVQAYPLTVEVDSLKRLTKCGYDYGGIFVTSAKGVCESLGGVFDPATLQCALEDLIVKVQVESCKSLGSTFNDATKACIIDNIVKEIQQKSCNSLEGTFEPSSGKCTNIRR